MAGKFGNVWPASKLSAGAIWQQGEKSAILVRRLSMVGSRPFLNWPLPFANFNGTNGTNIKFSGPLIISPISRCTE